MVVFPTLLLSTTLSKCVGAEEVYLHKILTSALGGGLFHDLTTSPPGKQQPMSSMQWMGGAGWTPEHLDAAENKKISGPLGIQPRLPSHPTCSLLVILKELSQNTSWHPELKSLTVQ